MQCPVEVGELGAVSLTRSSQQEAVTELTREVAGLHVSAVARATAPREEYFERVAEMAQRGGRDRIEFRLRHDSFFVEDLDELS